MKKWLILGICLLTSVAFAGMSYKDEAALKALLFGEKSEKLNKRMIQFYVSHPKTAEYFYEGGDVISSSLEKYCNETEGLMKKYAGSQSTFLAGERVANIRNFLSQKSSLTKAGLFLFLGVYSLDDYKDAKTWKNLLHTQETITTHFLNRSKLKADYQKMEAAMAEGKNPLVDTEKHLMTTIQNFCRRSADPFFNSVVFPMIKGCNTREDILKSLSPLRDETATIPGEIVTDAEEAFAELNEEMWEELTDGIENFFNRPETVERFIEIASDTFNIPAPPQVQL